MCLNSSKNTSGAGTCGVGIISNIEECKNKNFWIGKSNHLCYHLDGCSSIFKTQSKSQNEIAQGSHWEENQILTVIIDCQAWTLQFLIDDILIGKQIDIQPDHTYYPVISTWWANVEYQVIK
jgi:hypothetical protein